jgi:protein phosphatase 2C
MMERSFARMDVVVVNYGDQPCPLSSDEVERIEAAKRSSSFGRAQRCLAFLACHRTSTTTIREVKVADRAEGDECLITCSDGLWDVVPNETTCEVARASLWRGRKRWCAEAAAMLAELALTMNNTDNISSTPLFSWCRHNS